MKKMGTVLCALALLLTAASAGANDDLEWARQVTSRIEPGRMPFFAKSASDPRSRNWRESLNWNTDWQEALRASEIMLAHYPNDPKTLRLHHHILGQLHRWKEACDFGANAKEIIEKSGDLECLFWLLHNQFWFVTMGRLSVQDENWSRSFKKYRTTAVTEQQLALAESLGDDDMLYLSCECYAWHHSSLEHWKRMLLIAQRNNWQDRIQWSNMRIVEHYTHSNQIEKSIEWSEKSGRGTDRFIYVVKKDWPRVYQFFSPGMDYIEKATLRQPNERLQREVLTWNTRYHYDNTAVACAHLDKLNEAIEISERLHNRMLGMILGARFEQGRTAVVVKKKTQQQNLQSKLDLMNNDLALAKKNNDSDKIGAIQRDLKIQTSALTGLSQDIAADELEITAAGVAPKMSVPEMQSILSPDDALVIYYPTGTWFMTEGIISVLTQQQATCAVQEGLYVRAGDPAATRAKADDFLKALTSNDSSAERTESLRKSNGELYSLLIKPILPQIKDKRHLIIIPSGPLSTVPIHLLRDEHGKYLFEQHSVSYSPSVGVLKYALTRNRKISGEVTVVANPLIPQANSSLKFAETEAQAIAQVFPKANLLLGDRATETAVKAILDKAGILHFACHGILDTEEPMKSALALTPDETNDGMLTAREICDFPIKAGLVVLSACESGAGAPSAGWAELLGMTRSWLLAGAPSVVVSLWKLDDKATSELMAEFYKNLKTMSRAEALQRAQLTMMKKYENPYYWGAFVLYGDYR